MEKIILSFLFCGLVCLIAQIILDNTKLTPGHITSIFVIVGAFLDISNIYDKIVEKVGGGAMVPMGMFDLTASGITAAIIFAFFFTLIFKPRN